MISGIHLLSDAEDDSLGPLSALASEHRSWAADLRGLVPGPSRALSLEGVPSASLSPLGPDSGARIDPAPGPDAVLVRSCASTQDLAFALAGQGLLPPWGAVIAARQEGGRGQMRRAWTSPAGNLHASFLLPGGRLEAWNRVLPLVLGDLLRGALARLGAEVELKWPNDLVQRQDGVLRKVCGVLMEDRGGVTICGLGINLAGAPRDAALRADAAFSAGVLRVTNSFGGPLSIWRELVKCVKTDYGLLLVNEVPEHFVERLSGRILWQGEEVLLREGGDVRRVRLVGLSPDGGLLVASGSNVETIYSGSIFR
jgi:BirA family biotin operon repressor/biotin-[acetyl-CoA-carboxylase] ligase